MVRTWKMRPAWTMTPQIGTYGDGVPQPLEVRRANFAAWVRRVLLHARQARGLSVVEIAKAAGIGSQTIYRWRGQDWEREGPKPDQLVAFCNALGVSTREPFAILWAGDIDGTPPVEPLAISDPDLLTLARKLNDPNVPETEKFFIQETIAQLAARATKPAPTTARVVRRARKTG
jgi:transcriptional regulator with XRE-family HTH domain